MTEQEFVRKVNDALADYSDGVTLFHELVHAVGNCVAEVTEPMPDGLSRSTDYVKSQLFARLMGPSVRGEVIDGA